MDQYNKMPPAVQEVFDSLVGDKMLFGSRSMASRWATDTFNPAEKIGKEIHASTDYDIAAEFNQKNIDFLESIGFHGADHLYLKDDLTQEIFKKTIVATGGPFGQMVEVQVIMRKQNSLFMSVWENISAEYYYEYLWKRGPRFKRMRAPAIRKEIREAMNQLYSSMQFNMQDDTAVKVQFGDLL